jgi:hypothetical protein
MNEKSATNNAGRPVKLHKTVIYVHISHTRIVRPNIAKISSVSARIRSVAVVLVSDMSVEMATSAVTAFR